LREKYHGALSQLKEIFFRFFFVLTDTRQSLYRVPDKKHSAKIVLPTLFLPSGLCAFAECIWGTVAPGKAPKSGSACRVGGTNIDKHLPPPGVEYHAQEQPDELCIFASKGLDVVELSRSGRLFLESCDICNSVCRIL
jgi:hypothetical protein